MKWEITRRLYERGYSKEDFTALEIRFGPAPDLIRRSIESVQDEARLRSLHRIAIQATSLEAFARGLEG